MPCQTLSDKDFRLASQKEVQMKKGWPACKPGRQNARHKTSRTIDVNNSDSLFPNQGSQLESAMQAPQNEEEHFQIRLFAGPIDTQRNRAGCNAPLMQGHGERAIIRKCHNGIELVCEGTEDDFQHTLRASRPTLLFKNQDPFFHASTRPDGAVVEAASSGRCDIFRVKAISAVTMIMLRQ